MASKSAKQTKKDIASKVEMHVSLDYIIEEHKAASLSIRIWNWNKSEQKFFVWLVILQECCFFKNIEIKYV